MLRLDMAGHELLIDQQAGRILLQGYCQSRDAGRILQPGDGEDAFTSQGIVLHKFCKDSFKMAAVKNDSISHDHCW